MIPHAHQVCFGHRPIINCKIQDFEVTRQHVLRLIKYNKKINRIIIWKLKDYNGGGDAEMHAIDPIRIKVDQLKAMGVWDSIPVRTQKHIETVQKALQEEIDEQMVHVRSGRKRNPQHDDLPRDIACTTCDNVDYIPPSVLTNKALLAGLQGDDRQEALQTFLDAYQCSTCKPRRRGRAPSKGNADFPKEATCIVCGKPVKIVPSNIREKADFLGISVEELIENYKCRSCGGVVRRGKKTKSRKGGKKSKKV